jgi:hypothetical protein
MKKSETLDGLMMSLMSIQRTIATYTQHMNNTDSDSIRLLTNHENFIKETIRKINEKFPNEKQEESLYISEPKKEEEKNENESPETNKYYGGVFGVGQ